MEKLGKIVTIILWVLLIVSAVLVVSLMVNISENEADATMGGWINSNLVWAYILMAVGAGIAVLSGIFHMATDMQAAKKGLISIVFLVAVALVSYLLASDAIPQFAGVQKFINDGTLTPNVAKLVDTGLFATYILLGIAILSIVASSVTRIFK
ncbi:MAG: hypothetical protein PHS40_05340 [Mariniphaga sp.]|nr:hypothetical protein [Mariniphaga sp.]MDD4425327.1 hypothetical protein [Mariniphaga sp.]